jgi:septum site-determining protein MinC
MSRVEPQATNQDARLSLGTFTLAVITPNSADPQHFDEWLEATIAESGTLLEHAPVALDLGRLEPLPDGPGLLAMAERLRQRGMILAGLTGSRSRELETLAKEAGLQTIRSRPSAKINDEVSASSKSNAQASGVAAAKVIEQAVRAGQQMYAAEGDLVVQAAVNPGAEVVAQGSVHIYGKLMGRALAGGAGNEQARIYCQSLEAELVSIAGQYRMINQQDEPCWGKPSVVSLVDGQLHIKPLGGVRT